jgi:hypothetical protein
VYLGITFWSETLFCTFLFGLAYVFALPPERLPLRFLALGGLIVGMLLTRLAGMFVVPAVLVGVYFLAPSWRLRAAGAGAVILAVITTNLINTGTLTRSSRERAHCQQGLIALNDLEFCSVPEAAALCAMDPDRQMFGKTFTDSYQGMSWLQYGQQSPYKRFYETQGEDATCAAFSAALKHVIATQPFTYAWLLTKRVWSSFGPWDASEITPGACPTRECREASPGIERTLNGWKSTQHLNQLLLLLFPVLLWKRPKTRTPLVLFLGAAALFHAGGLAFNNPYPSLRYFAIHQTLLMLALLAAWSQLRSVPAPAGKAKKKGAKK